MGEYTVSEVAGEDAEQYILPDDQTVEILAGETVTVAMHNKLVPEIPTVPQDWGQPLDARSFDWPFRSGAAGRRRANRYT